MARLFIARRYGVRLVDWLVSRSLEINNGCLRYLAESQVRGHGVVTLEQGEPALDAQMIYSESVVAGDSRRILSMWQLVKPRLPRASLVEQHVHQLTQLVEKLADLPAPRRLGLSLASQAVEDENAKLMLGLVRSIPTARGPDWTELNETFTLDSALWRDAGNFAEVDDNFLSKRFGRAYRRGYKQAAALRTRGWSPQDSDQDTLVRLHRLTQSCQLATHHSELLRAVMSDKQKQQYWYLDKLNAALRTRQGIRQLLQFSRETDGSKKVAKRARKYLDGQDAKINRRIDRLLDRAFVLKPKKYAAQQREALDRLALSSVSKVSLAKSTVVEGKGSDASAALSS